MDRNLLLISARPEDLEFAAEVAINAGLSLCTIPNPVAAMELIEQGRAAVIFADVSTEKQYSALESAIQESVGLFSEKINANTIHFISSSDLGEARYLIQSPVFGHFILRNFGDPKEAGAQYARFVKATLNDRAFGLQQLLDPKANIQTIHLKNSNQKQDAVEAIKNYLIAAKFHTRMATAIANAVDELIMNAIYAAPTDSLGKPLLTATARTSLLKLEGKSAVETHIGFDGKYVAISAIDHYGSLDKAKLLAHISKVYVEEEYKVKSGVAGAGIGLATVFRSGGSFFFSSEHGVRTEVTVMFRRCDNYRQFKEQFRFISTQFYF